MKAGGEDLVARTAGLDRVPATHTAPFPTPIPLELELSPKTREVLEKVKGKRGILTKSEIAQLVEELD